MSSDPADFHARTRAVSWREIPAGALVLEVGELYEVLSCCGPIPCTWNACDVRLKCLATGEIFQARQGGFRGVQTVRLPERTLLYLYRADTGHVLYDPESDEELNVPLGLGEGVFTPSSPGVPCAAGFWRGRPVHFRFQAPAT